MDISKITENKSILPEVNSFDIFDTLLARSVQNPTDIFDIIEHSYPYMNFKKIRLSAQSNSNNTMDGIYNQFKLLTNENDETINKLRQFELKTEMKNTIPIMTNVVKINDGDIFVSDMYLSHDEIIELLNYHNINPNITLYVSSGGKANGEMWQYLINKYKIKSHIGDNYHSDVVMAKKFGINGIHTSAHAFTPLEQNYNTNCMILRNFRLMNTYQEDSIEYKLYNQQIQYNIPLLLFMCKKIVNILVSEKRRRVLFLSRDGCLIYKLFTFFYPQYEAFYVYSSRIINNNYNESYVNYMKNVYTEDSLLFDLHGSFSSGRKLFMDTFGSLPRIFIFDLTTIDNYYDKITYVTNHSNKIELFNQDYTGTLIDYTDKPIHMPSEIPTKYIKIIHNTIDQFIDYIKKDMIHIIDDNLFNNDDLWKEYYIHFVTKCEILFNNIEYHEKRLLTTLANKYESDKGNTSGCKHYYTLKYQEIISDIIKNDDIELLEIGFNYSNTDTIPSLMMWNDYFNKNITLTGFDINPKFSIFNKNNITIVIGDQSNENDLNQLTNKYDIIIDDGYHASKHQQISFKVLWKNVKPGGYYIIEDLHYQPEPETCMKTLDLFQNWKNGNWITSEYITQLDEINQFDQIDSINFYDSDSKLWGSSVKNAFLYIKKKCYQ